MIKVSTVRFSPLAILGSAPLAAFVCIGRTLEAESLQRTTRQIVDHFSEKCGTKFETAGGLLTDAPRRDFCVREMGQPLRVTAKLREMAEGSEIAVSPTGMIQDQLLLGILSGNGHG